MLIATARKCKSYHSQLQAAALLCLLAFPIAISLSGCMVAAVGAAAAAGAGAYAYYQGNSVAMQPAEFGETYQCTKAALNDLAMPIKKEHHDGLTGTIESSIDDGTHVTIKLEEKPRLLATDTHQTEIAVRVGVFGDSKVSTRLQQQIAQHVAQRKGTGNRLPPINGPQTIQPTGASAPPGAVQGSGEWKPASQGNAKVLPP